MGKSNYVQYSTITSGTLTVDDNGQDVQVIHDAGVTLTLTIAFPTNPVDGQAVFVGSVGGITTLSLTTAVGTIVNGIVSLATGAIMGYIYRAASNKWYKIR